MYGHRVALGLVAAKAAIIALLLALPSGLAIGLGAAHGVVLLIAGVTVAGLLVSKVVRSRRSGSDGRPGSMTQAEWNDSYADPPHWDLGRPQPAFRALADDGALQGRVLDAGCGTGEHVLMAAGLGLDATGVDIAPAALRAAERKARDRGSTARFLRCDARRLDELDESFDTVLDSGLFHIFDDEARAAYVASVRSVLRPGGRYFVLCFSDREPGDQGPRRITRTDIDSTFAEGWRIDSVDPATLDSPTDPAGIHGWLIALTRT